MRYQKIKWEKKTQRKKKKVDEVIDTCECGCGVKLKQSFKRNMMDACCVENFYLPNICRYVGKKIMFFASTECKDRYCESK